MIHKSMDQLVPATNIMFLLLPNVYSLTPFLYKQLFLCDFPIDLLWAFDLGLALQAFSGTGHVSLLVGEYVYTSKMTT